MMQSHRMLVKRQVLTDKTEGEDLTRVRAAAHGKGINAYINMYKWFTGTTGMAITERMKNIMHPGTPKNEHEIFIFRGGLEGGDRRPYQGA